MTKDQIKAQIIKMGKTPHCENCGSLNPQMIRGEGYTVCCNELLCSGKTQYPDRFGTEDNFVKACCWAVAEGKFMAEGRKIPEGACKL